MKLVFQGTLQQIKEEMRETLVILDIGHGGLKDTSPKCEPPTTTGIVEQDLSVVADKPKRVRRTKAEMKAAAKEQGNEPPVTLAEVAAVTKEPTHEIVQDPVKTSDDIKFTNFKNNFSQAIFLLLQQGKIDQTYITTKVQYYGLKNILEMKGDEKMIEHFYKTLVDEGKI